MIPFPSTSAPAKPAFGWRITKYDPRFREADGRYLRDEWIGPAQIGNAFADGVLTRDEYVRVEALYTTAVLELWLASNAPPLQIQALEGATAFGLPPEPDDLDEVGFDGWEPTNGAWVPRDRLEAILRWCLRDFGWCLLVGNAFYVHFGYDFLMFVGTSDAAVEVRRQIEASGLFVEPCVSPHGTAPSMRFVIEAVRRGEETVAHVIELAELPREAVAEIWPPVPSLVGYTTRKLDAELAARITRYTDVSFEFDEFAYSLDCNG